MPNRVKGRGQMKCDVSGPPGLGVGLGADNPLP